MNLHNVQFIKSAPVSKDVITDEKPQIVFSGKSNVGKSSVINKLLNRKQLARVSATPGKTIHINYFLIDNTAYFVDLPGYGYARVAKTEYKRWSKLMEEFFQKPEHITLGVMIVDSRHKPTDDDVTMAQWFKASKCPLTVVANKTDKVKKNEIDGNIKLIRSTLGLNEDTPILQFSAVKGTGREELIGHILRLI